MSPSITDAAAEACSDRLVAFLVDFVILSVVSFAIWIPFAIANFVLSIGTMASASSMDSAAAAESSVLVTMLVGIVITLVMWAVIALVLGWYFSSWGTPDGQTLGKGMQELVVVDANGGEPTTSQMRKRTAVLLAPIPVMALLGGVLGFIGFVLSLFLLVAWVGLEAAVMFTSDDGQRLGDRLADTYVVPESEA